MEDNWVYEVMASSTNSKQFEGNLLTSSAKVLEAQKDAEKAFRDSKKGNLSSSAKVLEAQKDAEKAFRDNKKRNLTSSAKVLEAQKDAEKAFRDSKKGNLTSSAKVLEAQKDAEKAFRDSKKGNLTSSAKVLEAQKDAEKAFRDSKKRNLTSSAKVLEAQKDVEKAKRAKILKDGPTGVVDDTDGCISDAVEYAKPKIKGQARPIKKKSMSVSRASPKSIWVSFDSPSAIENVKVNTKTEKTKNSGLHTFVRPDGKLTYILSFNL